ncbi:hypothetical protein [Tsukamurella strandjordii]|uniref:hypothetical protein n=1 Tax=Tsukamurella strandjordii TaxID=147577 RepID=UPI0031D15765
MLLEPRWAPVARGFLAIGIMVSMMVMLSFILTEGRGVAYIATAFGLFFVAFIPALEWGIDRCLLRNDPEPERGHV